MRWAELVFLSEEITKGLKATTDIADTQHLEFAGSPLHAYKKMVEDMKRKAMKQMRLKENDIIVRALRPTDLGLSTPKWTFNITNAQWNTMINTTVSDNRFIGIYGIVYLETSSQSISEIKITRAGAVARYWNIEGAILGENPYIFMSNPVTAEQNTNITIEGYGIGTNATEKMGFIGAVVEKRGLLVNP